MSGHTAACVYTAWIVSGAPGPDTMRCSCPAGSSGGGTGLSFTAPVSLTGNRERVAVDPHELAQPPGSDSAHGSLSQKNPPLFLEQEAGLWKVGMRWKISCLLSFTC